MQSGCRQCPRTILSLAGALFYSALRLQVGGKDYIMICSRGLHEFFIASSKAKMDLQRSSWCIPILKISCIPCTDEKSLFYGKFSPSEVLVNNTKDKESEVLLNELRATQVNLNLKNTKKYKLRTLYFSFVNLGRLLVKDFSSEGKL